MIIIDSLKQKDVASLGLSTSLEQKSFSGTRLDAEKVRIMAITNRKVTDCSLSLLIDWIHRTRIRACNTWLGRSGRNLPVMIAGTRGARFQGAGLDINFPSFLQAKAYYMQVYLQLNIASFLWL